MHDDPVASLARLMSAENANLDPRVRADWWASIGKPQPQQGPAKIDEAAYSSMSARDKMFYARQFDQPTGGRRR
jgi:hypothetical protein